MHHAAVNLRAITESLVSYLAGEGDQGACGHIPENVATAEGTDDRARNQGCDQQQRHRTTLQWLAGIIEICEQYIGHVETARAVAVAGHYLVVTARYDLLADRQAEGAAVDHLGIASRNRFAAL